MRTNAAADAHFAEFVEQHTDSLLTTSYLLTRDRGAAEELIQDVLVRLYPRWSTVMSADSALAYVRRSVVNRFLSQSRRKLELLTAVVPEPAHAIDDTAQLMDRDQLRQELAELPGRQRAVIVLRYFYDYSDQQIADAMDCRVGTVRSNISRALASLRAHSAGSEADSYSRGRTR